ncbi:uncharacterized protein TRAVEDRAFT_42525 [Trametes versicolor FP-101664 SS1]|uniref:uncharacterized protein n=1 Tax=Trametes versicolor (strain FP-101664) TaxID=717944 RepID=UPI000462311E|nr:uncharacterized protein TRAVEDRAFT_42525 [Trametes versicolor FP-101664 SS1]EIW65143.1 hypothetical protein TRAVEDRAFT_42525 [Trametes versicolor FP-101664 SS1]
MTHNRDESSTRACSARRTSPPASTTSTTSTHSPPSATRRAPVRARLTASNLAPARQRGRAPPATYPPTRQRPQPRRVEHSNVLGSSPVPPRCLFHLHLHPPPSVRRDEHLCVLVSPRPTSLTPATPAALTHDPQPRQVEHANVLGSSPASRRLHPRPRPPPATRRAPVRARLVSSRPTSAPQTQGPPDTHRHSAHPQHPHDAPFHPMRVPSTSASPPPHARSRSTAGHMMPNFGERPPLGPPQVSGGPRRSPPPYPREEQ